MPLVDVRGFDLDPRIDLRGLGRGVGTLQRMQQFGQQQQALERQEQIKQLLAQSPELQPQTEQERMLAEQTEGLGGALAEAEQAGFILSQEDMIREARKIDPAIANQQLKAMGFDDESKRAEASRFAAEVQSLPFNMREPKILERAEQLRSQGRDPKDTLELAEMEEDEQNQALTGVQLLDLSTKERFAVKKDIARAEAVIPKASQVKSSDILPDGTTIQVMGDGATRVTDPEGIELKGKERGAAIKKAQEFGISIQQRRAQARGVGKFTVKMAETVTDRADKLRANNDNLRKVISEVKAGAETGPLVSKLPSLRASSVRLENLKRQLGLDVIGSVTFGALSETELKMALDTALPTKLKGPELVQWAEDKITAQEKLAAYLEEQAAHLMRDGNTPETWKQLVQKRKEQPQVIKFTREGQRI